MNAFYKRLPFVVTAALFFAALSPYVAPRHVQADGCGPDSTPPLTGSHWADSAPKSVYIDPTLPAGDIAIMKQAVADFASQTGQSISVLPDGSPCPTSTAQDTITIMNNPSASPDNFAHEQSTNIYMNGQDTLKQVSAVISLNYSSTLPDGTPAYDPAQGGAAAYMHGVVLHELSHAYGVNDIPVPAGGYSHQTAGASIMNGSVNTNDQGPHYDQNGNVVAGGMRATSIQPCDKQQINSANPVSSASSDGGGSGNSGGGDSGGGSGGGDSGVSCYDYDEWNDETNTLTNYSGCS